MKTLKLILILFIATFFNCKAQQQIVDISTYNTGDNSNKYFKDINNHFTSFLGTWEYTQGSITFRVVLWKEAYKPSSLHVNSNKDEIQGKFYIIENLGTSNETIICESYRLYPNGNYGPESLIFASSADGISMTGMIMDNCAVNTDYMTGHLKMELLNTVPQTAHWTIKYKGMRITGNEFSIPTNTVFTKTN